MCLEDGANSNELGYCFYLPSQKKYKYLIFLNPYTMVLTQNQVNEYLKVKKMLLNKTEIYLSDEHVKLTEIVTSSEHGDIFKLDIRKGRLELRTLNTGLRAKECYILVRLDINDRDHRNPDGKIISGNHIHIYKENFGDSYSYPAEDYGFTEFDNMPKIIEDFVNFCNIKQFKVHNQNGLNRYSS